MSLSDYLVIAYFVALAALGLYFYFQQLVPLAKSVVVVAVLSAFVLQLWYPNRYEPDTRLKPGLDLAGGTTLIYDVKVPPDMDSRRVIDETIDVLRQRIDPTGTRNLIWRQIAGNRIEIQMALAPPETTRLREAYVEARDALLEQNTDADALAAALSLDGDARSARLRELAEGSDARAAELTELAEQYDAFVAAAEPYRETQRAHREAEKYLESLADASDAERAAAEQNVKALLDTLITQTESYLDARSAYEAKRDAVLAGNINEAQLERVLNLPAAAARPNDPGPRGAALAQLKESNPGRVEAIEAVAGAWSQYESVKSQLDDPNDLIQMLRGSGVLEFRIAADPGDNAVDVAGYRQQLVEEGPRAGKNQPWRWFVIDNIEKFIADADEMELVEENPAAYFGELMNLVGDRYADDYYVLLSNTPGQRMTADEREWELTRVSRTVDQMGGAALAFRLNAIGGKLLGSISSASIGKPMAIILDGRTISAPRLNSKITTDGIITGGGGGFTESELSYLLRTLRAGSLEGELGEYPISIKTTGPQLGQDNLNAGLYAAITALILVAIFMALYYWFSGLVADFALLANMVIILGVMAMIGATWTLPGIAGIVLTIGMAVDANVLIFERIREELDGGNELKAAIRLGYEKAFSTIIDANITTLITCFVLGYTASAEVKGFAVTLGIGICATLFTALFCTRVIFELYLAFMRPKTLPMLPTAIPALRKLLSPNIDWLGKRFVFFVFSAILITAGLVQVYSRGEDMLDIEFRSGTQVSFDLAGEQTLSLDAVRDRLNDWGTVAVTLQDDGTVDAADAPIADALRPIIAEAEARREAAVAEYEKQLAAKLSPDEPEPVADFTLLSDATVVTQGDSTLEDDGSVSAGSFSVSTLITDSQAVSAVIKSAFSDVLDTTRPIDFAGMGLDGVERASVYPVLKADLGEVINRAVAGGDAGKYVGGVAVVLDELSPAASVEEIERRIKRMRFQPAYETLGHRPFEVVGLDSAGRGDDGAPLYRSVVVLSRDAETDYTVDPQAFADRGGLADTEWKLISDALRRDTSLASVSNFSSQVSDTMKQQAIVAMLLSLLAVVAYIWLRFGSLRYGLAAIAALVHDVCITMGIVALAGAVYDAAGPTFLLLAPFKINLALVAALLTIVGYSLNDTIVVFDRIRENRGRMAKATPDIINDSINQTIARTVLTSSTTLLAVLTLYILGGAGIHGFAFALLIGVGVGTYSSIAIAAPLLTLGTGGAAGAVAAAPAVPERREPKGEVSDVAAVTDPEPA